jgi:hypothetical protein
MRSLRVLIISLFENFLPNNDLFFSPLRNIPLSFFVFNTRGKALSLRKQLKCPAPWGALPHCPLHRSPSLGLGVAGRSLGRSLLANATGGRRGRRFKTRENLTSRRASSLQPFLYLKNKNFFRKKARPQLLIQVKGLWTALCPAYLRAAV